MIICKHCETELEGFDIDSCCDGAQIRRLERENAELKKALAAIIQITHNNYDHDTRRIYNIASSTGEMRYE